MGFTKRIYQKIKGFPKLPYFIILIAVSLSYFNALNTDFIWDDEFLIEKNTYLRSFSHLPEMLISNSTAGFGGKDNFYRPTQNIYYLFIYQAFGYNKVAFHLGNILVHLLNAFLIFAIIRKIFKRNDLALLTSLFWVAHPTHVEAVTYISGTADPLSFLFCLLCLLSFPYSKTRISKVTLSMIFFFLALLSKEAIIVTPALLMLCIFVSTKENPFDWKKYLKTLPFWLLAFMYLIVREFYLNFDKTFNFYKTSNIYTENIHYRIYTFLATLPEYLVILFRPTSLHMERPFPVYIDITRPLVILGGFLVLTSLLLCLLIYRKKGSKFALFCWLWFFAAFVPMCGILVPVNSFILEHWLYIPSLGFFLGFCALLLWLKKVHKALPITIALLLISGEIYGTHLRNRDWLTPITFYNNILKYSEGSARVHNNLAMAYQDIQERDLAIVHYKKSISLSDTYPQTHYNLARAYIQKNKFQLALAHLNRSLEINPNFRYSMKLKKELLDFLKKQSPQ